MGKLANNKRDDIMNAALALFAERKYDGTTVPMIADKAQVGAGTIYRYFVSKEALVNVLFQDCVQNLTRELTPGLMDANVNTREKFHLIVQRLNRFAEHNIDALMFLDSHSNAHYLDNESIKIFNDMLNIFHLVLEDGKQKGIIKDFNSNALISIVWGAILHLFKIIKAGMLEKTPELLAGVEESCWCAIRQY